VATGQTVRRFEGHTGRINAVAFGGPDDDVLVSGSFDATLRLWDLKSKAWKPMMVLSEARDSISTIAVMGAEILTGSVDGRVRVYDIRMGRVLVDVIGRMYRLFLPSSSPFEKDKIPKLTSTETQTQ
jgi:mitogen-activated protein kinase organizer 1